MASLEGATLPLPMYEINPSKLLLYTLKNPTNFSVNLIDSYALTDKTEGAEPFTIVRTNPRSQAK